MREERWEEAASTFRAGLVLDPERADAWVCLGHCRVRQDRHPEAQESFDRALALDPADVHAWLQKWLSLGRMGGREEALHCFEHALGLDPGNKDASDARTELLAALGRGPLESPGPRSGRDWFLEGERLDREGNAFDAIHCYSRVGPGDPERLQALTRSGTLLVQNGQFEEALPLIESALALDRRDAHLWSCKGMALAGQGFFGEAVTALDKAISLDPMDAVAWSNKGNCLMQRSHFRAAVQCFEQAYRLDTRMAVALYNKGLAEQSLGRRADAIDSFLSFIAASSSAELQDKVGEARDRIQTLRAGIQEPGS